MAREVKGGSVAERILRVLVERYPCKASELEVMLHLRPGEVALELRRLKAQGLVTLEPLGDETYVALTGEGVTFLGGSAREAAAQRKRTRLPPTRPRDEDDPAFR